MEVENDRVTQSQFPIDYWGHEVRIELGQELCEQAEAVFWNEGVSLEEAIVIFVRWIANNSEETKKILMRWGEEQN